MRFFVVALALSIASCCNAPPPKKEGSTLGGAASPPSEAPVQVELKTLLKDYQDNEVKGDSLYKGKTFSFSGKINDIGVSLGSPYLKIGLTGEKLEHPAVQCMFDKSSNDKIAAMSKGSAVKVKGKVSGFMMLNVVVRDCDFLP